MPRMGVDFTDIVYEVTKNNGNYNLRINNETGIPFFFEIKSFDQYNNRFPVTSGLDHPNEISAYMLSQLYVSKLHGETPFNDVLPEAKKSCQQFLQFAYGLNSIFRLPKPYPPHTYLRAEQSFLMSS